jgi:hypothetical protein
MKERRTIKDHVFNINLLTLFVIRVAYSVFIYYIYFVYLMFEFLYTE